MAEEPNTHPAPAGVSPKALCARAAFTRFLWLIMTALGINLSFLVGEDTLKWFAPGVVGWQTDYQTLSVSWLMGKCLFPIPLAAFAVFYVLMRRAGIKYLQAVLPPEAPGRRLHLFLAHIPLLATLARPFACWKLLHGYLPRRLLALYALTPVIYYYAVFAPHNNLQYVLGDGVWTAVWALPLLWAVCGGITDFLIRPQAESARAGGIGRRAIIGWLLLAVLPAAGLYRTLSRPHADAPVPKILCSRPLPPGQNAARHYEKIFLTLDLWESNADDDLPPEFAEYACLPGLMLAPEAAEVYSELDRAAALPEVNFAYDYVHDLRPGGRVSLHARRLRQLFFLQGLRIRQALQKNDAETAYRLWRDTAALRRHRLALPTLEYPQNCDGFPKEFSARAGIPANRDITEQRIELLSDILLRTGWPETPRLREILQSLEPAAAFREYTNYSKKTLEICRAADACRLQGFARMLCRQGFTVFFPAVDFPMPDLTCLYNSFPDLHRENELPLRAAQQALLDELSRRETDAAPGELYARYAPVIPGLLPPDNSVLVERQNMPQQKRLVYTAKPVSDQANGFSFAVPLPDNSSDNSQMKGKQ